MRLTLILFALITTYPLSAQHAIVTTLANGSALIGVVNTQTKSVNRYLDIGGDSASAMAVSADGTHAYVSLVGYDYIDYLNLSSGAVEAQIPVPDGYPVSLAINPAGTRMYASYEGAAGQDQFTVATFNAQTNQLIQTATVSAGGTSIFTAEFGFSADQQTLFVAFQGSAIVQINALTGALISSTSLAYAPLGLSSSSSGNTLAVTTSINQQGTVVLLDPATLQQVSTITLQAPCASSIAVDAQGQFAYVIASAGCSPSAATEVLKVNLQTGVVVDRASTRSSAFVVELSPDQSELYVGETDNITEMSTSALAGVAEYAQPGVVNAVAVSPHGGRAYAANSTQSLSSYVGEGNVQVGISLNVGPAALAATQWGVATTSDGSLSFLASIESGAITVINNEQEKVDRFFASPVLPDLIAVSSPSGPLFIVSISKFASTPSKLTTVDVNTGKAILKTSLPEFGQTAIALSPDGSQVWITSGHDNLVAVYDAATLQAVGSFSATGPYALAFSSDSLHCYIALFGNNTGILDVDTQTLSINRTLAQSIPVPSAISISPDDQTLYVIGNGGTLYAVQAADGDILSSATVGSGFQNDFIVLSTDGKYVYVGDEKNLRLYDTQTAKVIGTITLYGTITSLSFTPF
jgi:DNA-binding beta-propeller fold protein YncE